MPTSAVHAASSDAPPPIDSVSSCHATVLQRVDAIDPDRLRHRTELLRDPQADIGRTGDEPCVGVLRVERRQRVDGPRRSGPCGISRDRSECGFGRGVVQRRVAGQRIEQHRERLAVDARFLPGEHRLARIEYRSIPRAAAQIAGQPVGEFLPRRHRGQRQRVVVAGRERHREARRAEAALRSVAAHHRLLCGMQLAGRDVLQVLDRDQRLAVERRDELQAGVDRTQRHAVGRVGIALGDDHHARAAVAFVAAFLGTDAAGAFAQPVQDALRDRCVGDVDDGAAMDEADGPVDRVGHGGASASAGLGGRG